MVRNLSTCWICLDCVCVLPTSNLCFFFFNDTATTELYTLSLHDALPISGGPVATAAGRASAGYLIFTGDTPRILLDVGGGAFKSLAESGVNVKDLDLVLLTHLHIDHTGDLSSVIKTIYFHTVGAGETRDAPIHIWGPASSVGGFPNTSAYVDGHYALPNGTERYLNGFTGVINAGTFNYEAHDLGSDWASGMSEKLPGLGALKVTAMPVKHGPVPAVAYRIDYKGKSIVYSGDTNSESGNMAMLAKDADLLIYDTAILDGTGAPFINLHTTPTRMGEVARDANARKLVLSHLTPITEPNLDAVEASVEAAGYTGEITVAKDLKVFNLRHDDD